MGFTVPGSNAGGGFGLGGIAGGLGALLQGLVQGHQMKLQNQEAQQRLQGEQTNNSINVFDTLSRLGQSDPALLQNPQFAAALQKNIGTGGIPLPTNPQGGLDTQAFLPSATSLLGNPQALAAWSRQPLAVRQLAIKNYGGSEEEKQQLLNLPVEASDSQVNGALTDLNRLANQAIIQGSPLVGPSLEQYNRDRQIVGMEPITDASQAPQIGAKTQSQIDSANSLVSQRKANTALTIDKDVMQKMRNKVFPQMNAEQQALTEARVGMTLAETAAIPMKAAAAVRNSMTAQGQLGVAQQRLSMAVSDFQQNGGMTNGRVSMLRGIASQMQTTVNQARVASDSAEKAVSAYALSVPGASRPIVNGVAPTPAQIHYQALIKSAQDTKGRFNQLVIENKKMPAVIQAFVKRQITKGGGPNSWNPVLNDVTNTVDQAMTQAQLQQFATAKKLTIDAARKYATSHGFTIQP